MQPIIDYFSKKFEENFNLDQNIAIDEGMIPWRGRLKFKVFNPSKFTKYGIHIRMICDSNMGYIFAFKIYSGTGQPLAKTVMDLLTRSYGKWHHLYIKAVLIFFFLIRLLPLSEFVRMLKKKGSTSNFSQIG